VAGGMKQDGVWLVLSWRFLQPSNAYLLAPTQEKTAALLSKLYYYRIARMSNQHNGAYINRHENKCLGSFEMSRSEMLISFSVCGRGSMFLASSTAFDIRQPSNASSSP
jgi:hypothetical protein